MDRRNTVQRALVLGAVYSLACHPTADEVYCEVLKSHPNMSKATVYRNLNLLCESGKLIRVPMPESADRFDHRTDGHYHIVCNSCNSFADVPCDYNYSLDKSIEKETGFKNATHNVLVRGICPNCASKKV